MRSKATVGNTEETSKSKLDSETIQPPFWPPSKAYWLLLEDESTRERWGEELSLLTVSNYLMSRSRVWKHLTWL